MVLQEGLTTTGNWAQAKIILLLILIVFGFLNGRQISNDNLWKPQALLVQIGIFMVSVGMISLAQVKQFPYNFNSDSERCPSGLR